MQNDVSLDNAEWNQADFILIAIFKQNLSETIVSGNSQFNWWKKQGFPFANNRRDKK